MTKHRVILTAIADDDPDSSAPGILEDGTEQCRMFLHILQSIHQDKAGTLTVKVKYRFVRDIRSLQQLRRGEIIHGRKDPEHGAGPDHQQVEVCRQYPINVSLLHKESYAKVSPIDFCLVDITRDEVPTFTQQELAHTLRIGLLRCTLVRVLVFISDDVD